MEQVTLPTPPTEEERQLYYYGLPSLPRFIARSSSHVWVNPQRPGFTTFTGTKNIYAKSLRPVGKHSLHQLWNNAASPLRAQILQAVSAADWTAIDIFCIGFNDDFPITLMVAVNPATLSWSDGYAITLQCKSILEAYEIYGVECEIRESVVEFYSEVTAESNTDSNTDSNTESNAQIPDTFQLSSARILESDAFNDIHVDISDRLGTKIAMKHMDSTFGTKGLYLSLQTDSTAGEPKLLALTCRHIVINPETEGLEKYNRQESGSFKDVIQIDQPTYQWTLNHLRDEARIYHDNADAHATQGNDSAAAPFEHLAKNATTLEQAMGPFVAPSSRVFGQLLFSPELTCIADPTHGSKWLRDWALIQLSPKHHQASFNSIENKVYVGTLRELLDLFRKGRRGLKGLGAYGPPIVDGCFELQKEVVPMEEILNPAQTSLFFKDPGLLVGKYGAKGGLTLGLGNTLMSLVRYTAMPEGITGSISEEWAILPIENDGDLPQAAFSAKGDSGSCVWDTERRPAGIIVAGAGQNGRNDITYAQPLERLLADIKTCGFEVCLV
ncbi:hypothetical protein GGI35DRAFT_486864 [Trichoderma velutinum]